MQVSQSLTDALKFTAPFTMETCTDEVAALRAFVNVVHMTELQPKIKAKHMPLVISKDVYKDILASRSGRTVSFFEIFTCSGTPLNCPNMYEWNTAVLSSEKSFANTEDRAAKKPEMIANGIKDDVAVDLVMDKQNVCVCVCT